MNHSMALDIITIVVMSIAVFYAARLNRALMRARDGRSELAQLITSLTDAHKKAESAIKGMRATAADYDAALQKQIVVSRGLIDELLLINESSNALANRLERLAPLARGNYEGTPYRVEEKPPAPLRAERSDRPASSTAAPVTKPYAPAQKAEIKPGAAIAKQAEATNSKSRAEQELFAAIETLRKGRQT